MTVGDRIKYYREQARITQTELAISCGISKQSLYKYENNIITNIPSDKIETIAHKLNVTPAIIMGWENNNPLSSLPTKNIYMCPLYDNIAAVVSSPAEGKKIDYIPTYIANPIEQERYFWVNVQGDSMSPLIDDQSKILIKMQDNIDSGQIGVVLIDGKEAVVKKIQYDSNLVELISVNPYYPPRRFEGAEAQRVRVVGLVKEVSKELK